MTDGLIDLQMQRVQISTFTTDKSTRIPKIMKQLFPDIKHQEDPWHFLKNIRNDWRPVCHANICHTDFVIYFRKRNVRSIKIL